MSTAPDHLSYSYKIVRLSENGRITFEVAPMK